MVVPRKAPRAQNEGQSTGRVPAIDLGATYADLKQEIDAVVERVLASGRYIGGPEVEGLESEFAAFCDVPHAVAVASGTDALRFALMAAGVGSGNSGGGARDEVITSPLSFVATTEAISQVGARPVFVDVDPESLTLDPGLVRKAITDRTRAIIPVHLYGQAADMGPILEMARARGVAVIEDACQAHGALYRGETGGKSGPRASGRVVGSLGDAGCFSFYPTKNLGACGEAGMLTTARADIAARVRRLRDHGQSEKYIHAEEGYNGRLDALQAAILRVKLKRLSGWNARRRALAALYSERLKGMGLAGSALRLPVEKPWGTHVYHLYTVRIAGEGRQKGLSAREKDLSGSEKGPSANETGPSTREKGPSARENSSSARDRVRAALLQDGIESGIHYPLPLHLQPCYVSMGLREGSFPVAESAAREVLSLPLFPEMTDSQVVRVCEALRVILGRG